MIVGTKPMKVRKHQARQHDVGGRRVKLLILFDTRRALALLATATVVLAVGILRLAGRASNAQLLDNPQAQGKDAGGPV